MKKIVIYYGGPIASGKTTSAKLMKHYMTKYVFDGDESKVAILSLGDAVKEEASRTFGFDIDLCYTQEGKNTVVDVPKEVFGTVKTTVRRCLQYIGEKVRNEENPDYWTEIVINKMHSMAEDGVAAFIIDDVRYGNEAMLLRLCAFPGDDYIAYGIQYLGTKAQNAEGEEKGVAPLRRRDGTSHISEWAIKDPRFSPLFDFICEPEFGNLQSWVALQFHDIVLANADTL